MNIIATRSLGIVFNMVQFDAFWCIFCLCLKKFQKLTYLKKNNDYSYTIATGCLAPGKI